MLTYKEFSEKAFDTRIRLKKLGILFSSLDFCESTKTVKIKLESDNIKKARNIVKKFKNLKIVIKYF